MYVELNDSAHFNMCEAWVPSPAPEKEKEISKYVAHVF